MHDDPLILLRCPRCHAEYEPDEFAGNEVPRCGACDWEATDPGPIDQLAPELEPVYRSDIFKDWERRYE
ncbi:MAG TPA: hypothetical protein VLC08_16390 [Chitinolyticbacter sp.]|nr:hypothetical protein [Chitinolyticbacter sp.]